MSVEENGVHVVLDDGSQQVCADGECTEDTVDTGIKPNNLNTAPAAPSVSYYMEYAPLSEWSTAEQSNVFRALGINDFSNFSSSRGTGRSGWAFAQELQLLSSPPAVNFWFGRGDTKANLHRDAYENLNAVIAGVKRFKVCQFNKSTAATSAHSLDPSIYLCIYLDIRCLILHKTTQSTQTR